jgi:large subunit ribosomal protein LP1
VCCMAALALYDGDAEITSNNISALLAASNNVVAPYWPGLFASMLKDGKAEELVFSLGGGGGGGGGGAPAGAADAGKFFLSS